MKRTMTRLALVWISMLVTAYGAEKSMTVEDSLAIKNVSGPQFSPDGKRIAYTISEWDKEKDRRVSHIYLVSADGGQSTKLTNGENGESAPHWSPDGRKIAFLANRDKGNQIWIINTDGGEAVKLTSDEEGVSALRWAPDSKRIAFVTRDVPKDKDDREKKKKDKFDAILVDRNLLYSHLWVIQVDSKEKRRLTEGAFSAASPQLSPDGQWLAFEWSNTGSQESSYTDISADRNTDIYVVSANGGTPRQLTTNPAADSNPAWSPDGREIAYVSNTDPKSWAAKSDILVIPAQGGTPRHLTGDFFESAGMGLSWSRDGKTLYFVSGVGTDNHVFSVPAAGGAPKQITKGHGSYGQFDLSPDGTRIAYTLTDSRNPNDIWLAPVDGGAAGQQITFANPQLKEFAVADTEVIRWKGPDNFDIEGLLVKPLGFEAGKKYPLILSIHGGPYGKFNNSFDSRAQIFAANGYAMLMPNPRGSTGYGHKFTVANVADWGGKDFQDYMAGVDEVIAKGVADPGRLVVMGGSYGGFSTFWTITQTNRFKAAIGHAGISDWYAFHGQSDIPGLMEYGFVGYPWTATETYRKYSPMTYVSNVRTPIMITHGEQDRRVPIAQAEEYYRALKSRGIDVVFVRYPREGHGIQEPNHQIDLVHRQLEWFDAHLGISRPNP